MQWAYRLNLFILVCLICLAAGLAVVQEEEDLNVTYPGLDYIRNATLARDNITQLIRSYGYQCDDYWAETEDGYLLSLQRIYPPSGARRGVVYLQHGLTDNSAGFCLNLPSLALPFILADNGYEVWLGNNRGNGVSMRHKTLNPMKSEFWNFSFDHMAKYDLPANINFVLKTSGAATMTYIGHSQGTIQAFAGFSSNNAMASRVNLFIALAPVAYVGNVKTLFIKELAKLNTAQILLFLGLNEFNLPSALQKIIPGFCKILPPACNNVLAALMGPSDQINQTRLPFYLSYEPNPTSVRNMIHWSQSAAKNTFRMYDWGVQGNLKEYGQATPPDYDLSKMPPSLPVALFTGSNDYLATPADVARLKKELRPPAVYEHNEESFSHIDFLWATNAYRQIYPPILQLIQKYNRG
jgi:pimeloyl-ACP methyl ester carboxylesterase